MSDESSRLVAFRQRLRPRWRTAVEICFGDDVGLTLFLATLAFFLLTTTAGAFFNDIGLYAFALEHLGRGDLSLGTPQSLETGFPGMHYADGNVYARNYGQIVAALPVYWILTAVGPWITRAVLVLGWTGLLIAVGSRIGAHYGRLHLGLLVGGAVGAIALFVNVALFEPFVRGQLAILSLKLVSMVVGASTGVLLYRVFARRYDTTSAVLAGAITVFGTPVGLWAVRPKRHAFAAFFVVLTLYALARSRDSDATDARLGQAGFRGIAYASAGFLAWIHAPEGFTLFLATAIVDLPTGRKDRRSIVIVGGTFLLSLVPFFVTNYLISGNPLDPPRFLPDYPESVPDSAFESDGADGGSGSSSSGTSGGSSSGTSGGTQDDGTGTPWVSIDRLVERFVPAQFIALLNRGFGQYGRGFHVLIDNQRQVVTVFIRWEDQGYDPGNSSFGGGTNLSILESMPLAVTVAIAPVRYGVQYLRTRSGIERPDFDTVDAFAVVCALLFVFLYIPRLPSRVMVTVRYLHPLYPLLVYAAFRQSWVREILTTHLDDALRSYVAVVVLETPLVFWAMTHVNASTATVMHWFAVAALVTAACIAVLALGSVISTGSGRLTAVAIAVAAGTVTVFLIVGAIVLWYEGKFILPFVDPISSRLRWETLPYV